MSSLIASRPLPRCALQLSELGFGAAPLGNLYRPMAEAVARDTLQAAVDAGLRYVDTAPYYGFGLSERRVGDVLRGQAGVAVSSKVGRLLQPLPGHSGEAERHGFCSPLPFTPVYDYSYDGVMRSWEASLQRLGLARIDILYVHDIGRFTHGTGHAATFSALTEGGGFRALEYLRAEGAITAFGLGVNEWPVCLEAMQHADLDVVLLAGRYTLLDQSALDRFLPACLERGVRVVVGGVYNSGILAAGTRSGAPLHYDYAPASGEVVERVRCLEAVCEAHGVPLAAAALQFPLAHPAVVSVIPGLDSVQRVAQTLELYRTAIPSCFWQELRRQDLLRQDAPVPEPAS